MPKAIDSNERTVTFDSNMVLLLMCASLRKDPQKHKRLNKYHKEDVTLIEHLASAFTKIVVTPNILTEVSNLAIDESELAWLAHYVNRCSEVFVPSKNVTDDLFLFTRFGLTDLCLLRADFDGIQIVTDDDSLANYLRSEGKNVVYYSEYKELKFGLL